MRRSSLPALPTLVLVLIVAGVAAMARCRPTATHVPGSVQVYFSPRGGCTEAVVEAIEAAKQTIRVQAYSFTSVPIAKALVEAHERGVDVKVILDRSQETEKYSSADFLLHSAIPVGIDASHAIAHNKIVIVDGEVVVTGSFNFTKQAEESNAENLLIIHDKGIAATYAGNWEAHAEHAHAYTGEDKPKEDQRRPDNRKDDRGKSDRGKKEPSWGKAAADAIKRLEKSIPAR